ncbi:transcription antitermination factor NusB [Gaopeijia maritima]|uniref:Transcription antitermination protein NusB n=1 Tax=Gaopeijia maritima TaxID=3119007 RepID=A0ABU9E8Y0_9BACT
MMDSFVSQRDRIDRVRARAWALQVLYRWEAGGGGGSNLRDALVETTATRRIAPRRLPFVRLLLDTVDEHLEDIDARLRRSLDNWRMERLSAIDRGVLRLGAAELLFLEEIPPKVAIQEAVRLAEQYGGPDSPRFVNGVLDALYRRMLADAGG